MPIEFLCSECSTKLRVPDGTEGKRTQCPTCGHQLTIPGTPPESQSTSPVDPTVGSPFAAPSPSGTAGYRIPPPAEGGPAGDAPPGHLPPPGTSDNPYQAPSSVYTAAPTLWMPAANAADQVRAPAIGLLVASITGTVISVLSTALILAIVAWAPQEFDDAVFPFELIPQLVSLVLGVAVGTLGIVGSISMLQLRRRGLAMAGAILMAVPCFSPCCPLGLPFGVWALVVLSDGAVQAAFQN